MLRLPRCDEVEVPWLVGGLAADPTHSELIACSPDRLRDLAARERRAPPGDQILAACQRARPVIAQHQGMVLPVPAPWPRSTRLAAAPHAPARDRARASWRHGTLAAWAKWSRGLDQPCVSARRCGMSNRDGASNTTNLSAGGPSQAATNRSPRPLCELSDLLMLADHCSADSPCRRPDAWRRPRACRCAKQPLSCEFQASGLRPTSSRGC